MLILKVFFELVERSNREGRLSFLKKINEASFCIQVQHGACRGISLMQTKFLIPNWTLPNSVSQWFISVFFSDCKLLQLHQGSHKKEWLDKSWSRKTIFVSPGKIFSVMKLFEKTFPSEVILQFLHQKRSPIQMNSFHRIDLSDYLCPKRSIVVFMKKTRTRKAFIWRSFLNWLEHYSESRFLSQRTFEKKNGRCFLKLKFVISFDPKILAISARELYWDRKLRTTTDSIKFQEAFFWR